MPAVAAAQREISVAEFFAKNRHLLGFDNPAKAVLTTVREAVDNSLDACEEAGILPEIHVEIRNVAARKEGQQLLLEDANGKKQRGFGGADRLIVSVQDNGPGIVKEQIPKIFGKLLYGSKFHRLRMSRGQQGIGISAAALYSQLTTDNPIDLTRYQLANCYMGRAPLINSGGASSGEGDLKEAVKTAVINKRAGGMGLISGRKAFQRPIKDGVALLNAIQDVYLSKEVTIA